MLFVVLICVAASLWCLNWMIYNGKGMDVFKKIPGPKMLPFVGNSLHLLTDRVRMFYRIRRLISENKNLYRFFVPPYKVVAIYNPEDIEIVLSTPKFNEKGAVYDFMKPWLQEGLLLSNGPKWHSRRKILTPAFHFNILRHFCHILEENSWKLVEELEERSDEDKTNIVPLLSRYTLNSICETAMGTKLDDDESGDCVKYKEAIYKMGAHILNRITRFWLHNDYLFKFSPTGIEQRRTIQEVKSFPRRVINERRKYRELFGDEVYIQGDAPDEGRAGGKRRLAMLDLLLAAEKQGLIDEDGIQEEVDTFMFEGHDTTALGLVFTLMLLANHKKAQDMIVEECRGIFGESTRPASMSDLQQMKYLECCVKEGLRLYPPVPFISRRIGENVQLKHCEVPAGTLCDVYIYDLHRRPELFREPLQFRPERFLAGRGEAECGGASAYAYIPFSAGPRNCIGQRFAMLEMKSAISAVLRTFELRAVTAPADVILTSDLVLRPHNPIYVKFLKRK